MSSAFTSLISKIENYYGDKDYTTQDAEHLSRLAIVEYASQKNALVASARQVSSDSIEKIIDIAIKQNLAAQPSEWMVFAANAVDNVLGYSHEGILASGVGAYTDFLPEGHPSRTNRPAMTASVSARSTALWVAGDPRIASDQARLDVYNAYSTKPGSVEAEYAGAKLSALVSSGYLPADVVLPITAAFKMNFAMRSAIAKALAAVRRRHGDGRFAEEFGRLKGFFGRKDGSIFSSNGRIVGAVPNTNNFEVAFPGDADIPKGVYTLDAARTSSLKAVLSSRALKKVKGLLNRNKSIDMPTESEKRMAVSLDEFLATRKDAPSGWTKNEDGSFTSKSGHTSRVVDAAPEGDYMTEGIGESGKIDPAQPIFELTDKDGKTLGIGQDWAGLNKISMSYDALDGKLDTTTDDEPGFDQSAGGSDRKALIKELEDAAGEWSMNQGFGPEEADEAAGRLPDPEVTADFILEAEKSGDTSELKDLLNPEKYYNTEDAAHNAVIEKAIERIEAAKGSDKKAGGSPGLPATSKKPVIELNPGDKILSNGKVLELSPREDDPSRLKTYDDDGEGVVWAKDGEGKTYMLSAGDNFRGDLEVLDDQSSELYKKPEIPAGLPTKRAGEVKVGDTIISPITGKPAKVAKVFNYDQPSYKGEGYESPMTRIIYEDGTRSDHEEFRGAVALPEGDGFDQAAGDSSRPELAKAEDYVKEFKDAVGEKPRSWRSKDGRVRISRVVNEQDVQDDVVKNMDEWSIKIDGKEVGTLATGSYDDKSIDELNNPTGSYLGLKNIIEGGLTGDPEKARADALADFRAAEEAKSKTPEAIAAKENNDRVRAAIEQHRKDAAEARKAVDSDGFLDKADDIAFQVANKGDITGSANEVDLGNGFMADFTEWEFVSDSDVRGGYYETRTVDVYSSDENATGGVITFEERRDYEGEWVSDGSEVTDAIYEMLDRKAGNVGKGYDPKTRIYSKVAGQDVDAGQFQPMYGKPKALGLDQSAGNGPAWADAPIDFDHLTEPQNWSQFKDGEATYTSPDGKLKLTFSPDGDSDGEGGFVDASGISVEYDGQPVGSFRASQRDLEEGDIGEGLERLLAKPVKPEGDGFDQSAGLDQKAGNSPLADDLAKHDFFEDGGSGYVSPDGRVSIDYNQDFEMKDDGAKRVSFEDLRVKVDGKYIDSVSRNKGESFEDFTKRAADMAQLGLDNPNYADEKKAKREADRKAREEFEKSPEQVAKRAEEKFAREQAAIAQQLARESVDTENILGKIDDLAEEIFYNDKGYSKADLGGLDFTVGNIDSDGQAKFTVYDADGEEIGYGFFTENDDPGTVADDLLALTNAYLDKKLDALEPPAGLDQKAGDTPAFLEEDPNKLELRAPDKENWDKYKVGSLVYEDANGNISTVQYGVYKDDSGKESNRWFATYRNPANRNGTGTSTSKSFNNPEAAEKWLRKQISDGNKKQNKEKSGGFSAKQMEPATDKQYALLEELNSERDDIDPVTQQAIDDALAGRNMSKAQISSLFGELNKKPFKPGVDPTKPTDRQIDSLQGYLTSKDLSPEEMTDILNQLDAGLDRAGMEALTAKLRRRPDRTEGGFDQSVDGTKGLVDNWDSADEDTKSAAVGAVRSHISEMLTIAPQRFFEEFFDYAKTNDDGRRVFEKPRDYADDYADYLALNDPEKLESILDGQGFDPSDFDGFDQRAGEGYQEGETVDDVASDIRTRGNSIVDQIEELGPVDGESSDEFKERIANLRSNVDGFASTVRSTNQDIVERSGIDPDRSISGDDFDPLYDELDALSSEGINRRADAAYFPGLPSRYYRSTQDSEDGFDQSAGGEFRTPDAEIEKARAVAGKFADEGLQEKTSKFMAGKPDVGFSIPVDSEDPYAEIKVAWSPSEGKWYAFAQIQISRGSTDSSENGDLGSFDTPEDAMAAAVAFKNDPDRMEAYNQEREEVRAEIDEEIRIDAENAIAAGDRDTLEGYLADSDFTEHHDRIIDALDELKDSEEEEEDGFDQSAGDSEWTKKLKYTDANGYRIDANPQSADKDIRDRIDAAIEKGVTDGKARLAELEANGEGDSDEAKELKRGIDQFGWAARSSRFKSNNRYMSKEGPFEGPFKEVNDAWEEQISRDKERSKKNRALADTWYDGADEDVKSAAVDAVEAYLDELAEQDARQFYMGLFEFAKSREDGRRVFEKSWQYVGEYADYLASYDPEQLGLILDDQNFDPSSEDGFDQATTKTPSAKMSEPATEAQYSYLQNLAETKMDIDPETAKAIQEALDSKNLTKSQAGGFIGKLRDLGNKENVGRFGKPSQKMIDSVNRDVYMKGLSDEDRETFLYKLESQSKGDVSAIISQLKDLPDVDGGMEKYIDSLVAKNDPEALQRLLDDERYGRWSSQMKDGLAKMSAEPEGLDQSAGKPSYDFQTEIDDVRDVVDRINAEDNAEDGDLGTFNPLTDNSLEEIDDAWWAYNLLSDLEQIYRDMRPKTERGKKLEADLKEAVDKLKTSLDAKLGPIEASKRDPENNYDTFEFDKSVSDLEDFFDYYYPTQSTQDMRRGDGGMVGDNRGGGWEAAIFLNEETGKWDAQMTSPGRVDESYAEEFEDQDEAADWIDDQLETQNRRAEDYDTKILAEDGLEGLIKEYGDDPEKLAGIMENISSWLRGTNRGIAEDPARRFGEYAERLRKILANNPKA